MVAGRLATGTTVAIPKKSAKAVLRFPVLLWLA